MACSIFERLLRDSSGTVLVELDPDGNVTDTNRAFADHAGLAVEAIVDRPLAEFLPASEAGRMKQWIGGAPLPDDFVRMNFSGAAGSPFTLRCLLERHDGRLRLVGESEAGDGRAATEEMMHLNNELATMARERARSQRELERARVELERTLEELQTSYWHLQKLQEVLPVCVGCGKVKTDKADEAEWQNVVDYLAANEIFLSHGYCPTCLASYEREIDFEVEEPS